MTLNQRQAAFERLLTALARRRADRLKMGYVGTIRRLAPPPLPGEKQGTTLYYVNAAPKRGGGPELVGLGNEANALLRRAERWVESGEGPPPAVPAPGRKAGKVKT